MRRKIWIVLLALGTIGGYGAGVVQLVRRAHGAHDRFERHIAEVCVEAARGQAPSR